MLDDDDDGGTPDTVGGEARDDGWAASPLPLPDVGVAKGVLAMLTRLLLRLRGRVLDPVEDTRFPPAAWKKGVAWRDAVGGVYVDGVVCCREVSVM